MSALPTILVLAAGKGERFKAAGGTEDKLNATLGGQRVRDHVMAAVQASGLPCHVVEREHTQPLTNPGMGDSIACGVAAGAG
ncbi:MAG: NTP transferase domain-containing protein, partial [Limnohabitans sp.]